ncbi:MAG TPA: HK97-gp10 family putative phage morphogenesis protein [Roseiflexaceae bacterium]|nr:HK97-gp10 family putative phage morphogenesis protein [Roseiflexaceae bacterium]
MPLDMSGLERVRSALPRAVDATEQASTEAIARHMRELVTVRTGATQLSIEVEPGRVVASEGAPYLEFGTPKMDAQPFATPAIEQLELTEVARVFTEGIKR